MLHYLKVKHSSIPEKTDEPMQVPENYLCPAPW